MNGMIHRFRFLIVSSFIVGSFVASFGVVSALGGASSVTICATKSGELRYAKDGVCKTPKETALILGETGPAGATGPVGPAGATGPVGPAGATGPAGAAESAFAPQSLCGNTHNQLCSLGSIGPGGGYIVYIDTANRSSEFDYLEVAPTDASTGAVWSTDTQNCGLNLDANCQINLLTSYAESAGKSGLRYGQSSTNAIVERHNAGGAAAGSYAAGIADSYTTPLASDWFLPSYSQLGQVWNVFKNVEPAINMSTAEKYWSSTELSGFYLGEPLKFWAMTIQFNDVIGGTMGGDPKSTLRSVRPMRSF